MSLKSKRICKCCGKEYEYCPHCGTKSDEMWKNLTDTKECLAVFNIVAAYNVGRVTAEQVKRVLEENKVKDYSKFKRSIVDVLDKIYKTSNVPAMKKVDRTTIAESAPEKVIPTAPHIYEVTPIDKQTQSSVLATHDPTVQSAPRKKSRNGKKYRQRNTDIEL